MKSIIRALFTGVALTLLGAGASAQQYPSRPIQIIVPLPVGTAIDMATRIIADPLGARLGQPVVVMNRGGNEGTIGAVEVVRAPADGYTLLMGTNGPLSAAPLMSRAPQYDVMNDFTPISFIGKFTHVMLVNPNVPAATLAEFFNYVQANPGKINFGSGNTYSLVSTAQLMKIGHIQMTHVPYKGEPQALIDLVANRVQFMFSTKAVTLPFIKDGRVRALAVTDLQRDPAIPNVPTLAEAGVPRFANLTYAALVGPAKMPREVVERINRELKAVLEAPEVRAQLARLSFEGISSTPDELGATLKTQWELWSTAVRELNLRNP